MSSNAQRIGLIIVFVWFFLGGIAHFLVDDFFIQIVPPGILAPETAVYVSGLFEIVGALALLSRVTRPWAGWGLFLLTLCVTPANLHMWMNADLYPQYPEALLALRLVLQVFLLALILFSTQPLPQAARRVATA